MIEKGVLSGLIEDCCAELESADTLAYEGHVFSKAYQRKKRRAISIAHGRPGRIVRKTTLLILAAAVLLAGCGAALAFEPVRSFLIETYRGGQTLTPDPDTAAQQNYREPMEEEYIIDVPQGFEPDGDSAHGYTHFGQSYRRGSDVIYFDQYRNDVFETHYPPETEFVTRTDRDGKEVLAARPEQDLTELYWNTGEYTLKLGGSLSEEELMEIYYTARVK